MDDETTAYLNSQLEKLNKAASMHDQILQTISRRHGPATEPRLRLATEIETVSLDMLYTAIEAACRRHEIYINNLICELNRRFRHTFGDDELRALVDRFQSLYSMINLRMEIRWR